MRRMTNFWAFIKKLAGLIGFTGNKIEVGNDLEVDGKLKAFENITDVNDNLRFVEGEINLPSVTGVTYPFTKWSLSGSHLMIVICGNITQGTTFSIKRADITIPQWLLDKITPLTATYVNAGYSDIVDNSYAQVGRISSNLEKTSTNLRLNFICVTEDSPTSDGSFRLQYDLII